MQLNKEKKIPITKNIHVSKGTNNHMAQKNIQLWINNIKQVIEKEYITGSEINL